MSIEEFELKVKNLWIEFGLNNEKDSWFTIGISSDYKDKSVRIFPKIRLKGGSSIYGDGKNYKEAFNNALKRLREVLKYKENKAIKDNHE